MSSIRNFSTRVQAVNIDRIIGDSLEATKDEIGVLNKSDLLQGYLSTGDKIVPQYRFPLYAEEKAAQNPLAGLGTPDLRLTGAFYEGIRVVINRESNSFTIGSTDEKATMLEKKYSPRIFGLTKESKSLYAIQTLKPVLLEKVRSAIGV